MAATAILERHVYSWTGGANPKDIQLSSFEALIYLDFSSFDFSGISLSEVLQYIPPEYATPEVIGIINQILSGDLSLVIQGQDLMKHLYNTYGPSVSLYDALVAEGIYDDFSKGTDVADYIFNELPSFFDFSDASAPGGTGIESPLYELDPDGSWNPYGVFPDLNPWNGDEIRDHLFDQLGGTAVEAISNRLGSYGEAFLNTVDSVKDVLEVKKVLTTFVGNLLDQLELGFDAVSGKNNITFEEYDQMTESNVQRFREDTREYLEGKYGEAGGLLSDVFSGKIFGLSEVNSFKAVIYDEGTLVVGGPKKDTFLGSNGADSFRLSEGGDMIVGSGGDDLFYLDTKYGGAKISGGAGLDTLVTAKNSSSYTVSRSSDGFDITGADGKVETRGIERIDFSDRTLALDTDGTAGQVYRLYQAAFDRVPDTEGLSYWVDHQDNGRSDLNAVADSFIHSPEFILTYGSPETVTNAQYVELLYNHTLGRVSDQEGFKYWVGKLDNQQTNRGDLLAFFSESDENVARVAPAIEDGIWLL